MSLETCRLCGSEKRIGVNLLDRGARIGLFTKILELFSKEVIQIDVNDMLSKFVCKDCEITVNHFSEFCELVKKTQKILHQKTTIPSLSLKKSVVPHIVGCHNNGTESVNVTVASDGKFKCEICETSLDNVQTMTLHMVTHGLGTVVCRCRECGHSDEVSCFIKDRVLVCPTCFFTANKPTDNNKKHVCEVCNKSFRTMGHKNRHKMIHDGLKPYLCETCGVRFSQKASLKIHTLSHKNAFPFSCEWCGQSFRYKVSLTSHTMNVHSQASDSKHECDQCKKQFATAHKLQRHYRSHTGEQPYRCSICNRTFSQSGNYNAHMLNHKTDFTDFIVDDLLKTPPSKTIESIYNNHTSISDADKDYTPINEPAQLKFNEDQNNIPKEAPENLFGNFQPHDCVFDTIV
ncbi:zinc finger protein 708 [Nilaparvata lugens]|uniref:zinc finger protein 708 n=1 Tax=Nilaparvata lugens TaxID=108931 RepID=UPI00193CDE9A|nr:zinc finger protein 708 [Nilaparvata lugens]